MTPFETPDAPPLYRLKFVPDALAEWEALDGSVRNVLRKLLKKRLEQPKLPGSRLHGDLHNCYKIKLKKQGYRLVYQGVTGNVMRLLDDAMLLEKSGLACRERVETDFSFARRVRTMEEYYDFFSRA